MMCRSSKSTPSDFLPVRLGSRAFVTLLAAWLVNTGSALPALQAQVPTASPDAASPAATPKPQAYVRFWNMLVGPNSPELQLLATEDKILTAGSGGNASAGYLAMDPGTYTFVVRRPNDPAGVIKRLPVVLRTDVYITLLVAAGKDGKPDMQLIDDTVNLKTDNGLGKLVVRQFFPGASVMVGVNAEPAGPALAFGESTTRESLPLHGAIVNMRAGIGPTVKNWNVEADFANGGHHATMLVIPDPYGRFRPRLVFDGAAGKPLPAAGPSAAPASRRPPNQVP